jgi:peptidoglycan/xylan/chitin deacetylase (PgdA/CDA1 family)
MPTVLGIMDGGGWAGNTDIVVVADPERKLLRWVPRDLWCDRLGDRINTAFRQGRHRALIAALGEHGIAVQHSVCLQREATERACGNVTVTVPVEKELAFWYPLRPREPIEQGRKLVSFRPPREVLKEERIHQWIGARYAVDASTTDFDRIRRQQVLLTRLFEQRYDFSHVVANPELVDWSSDGALSELRTVDSSWRLDALDDVIDATVDGKRVLLQRGRSGQLRRGFPILTYHRIGDPPPEHPSPGHYVTRTDFAGQLQELSRRGYTAVTQHELYDGWNAEHELPAKPLVISFDDGHVSVWREAFPLLAARGWPAVLNLLVSTINSDHGLTSGMVHDLVDAGWDLGAHSRTHPDLTQLDPEHLDDEVHGSRQDLEEEFDICVDFFCYPSGRLSTAVVDSVMRAGYLGATTSRPGVAGPEDLFTMPRIRVSREDTATSLAERLEDLSLRFVLAAGGRSSTQYVAVPRR